MKTKQFVAVLVAIVIVAAIMFGRGLSVVPSFEGLNAGVYSATLGGSNSNYLISSSLPPPYYWGSQDIHNAQLWHASSFLLGRGAVRIEVGFPQQYSSWLETGQKVDYWVKVNDTNFVHVVGQVNIYTLSMTVSSINTGDVNQYVFQGEKIWIQLAAVTWDRAYQDVGSSGSPVYIQAWEAPLAVFISSFQEDSQGSSHAAIDPSYQGRFITLYSEPNAYGTLDDLGLQAGGNVNSTLGNNLAPDSRMVKSAFFPITLTNFGITEDILGGHAPVVNYQLKIYTLQLGRYTYTNPDDTPWGKRPPEGWGLQQLLNAINDWLSNPLNIPWILLGIGLVVLVLILVFAPWLLGLAVASRRKSR